MTSPSPYRNEASSAASSNTTAPTRELIVASMSFAVRTCGGMNGSPVGFLIENMCLAFLRRLV